jgi:hypothetical protein
MQAKYYVYEWIRPDYNVAFNVGKGKGRRAWSMHNRNKHCRDVVNYLNKNGLNYEVRIIARFINEQSAYDYEEERIAFFGLENLTNDLPGGRNGGGGMTGKKHKPETIERMCAAQKGKIISLEARRKLKVASTGKKASEETRTKMSVSQTGRIHSEETKQKIGVGNSLAKSTVEAKQKASLAAKESQNRPEVIAKKSVSIKKALRKNLNHWTNKLSQADIWNVGTLAASKIDVSKKYGISVVAVDEIRKIVEERLGVPARRNFGRAGRTFSAETIEKCKIARKSNWDSLTVEQRLERGRKMSEGRARAKLLKEGIA